MQELRLAARAAAGATAAVDMFSRRFGLTLEELEDLYANSTWKDYADVYGGTAWRVIVHDHKPVFHSFEIDDHIESLRRRGQNRCTRNNSRQQPPIASDLQKWWTRFAIWIPP